MTEWYWHAHSDQWKNFQSVFLVLGCWTNNTFFMQSLQFFLAVLGEAVSFAGLPVSPLHCDYVSSWFHYLPFCLYVVLPFLLPENAETSLMIFIVLPVRIFQHSQC
jgi:hypothetical protein